MKAYKGFNRDMTCNGFQYEEGKEYHEDKAELCYRGFHACEMPLNVFNYYSPGSSRYHEVELGEVSPKRGDDTKICGKTIKIGAKLNIADIVSAQIEYVKSNTTTDFTDPKAATAGDYGAATAGNYGAATAGDCGAATAGNRGAATAGNCGAATAGYRGAATAGDRGAATVGNRGAATSRGKSQVGENGAALARGDGVKVKGGMGSILLIAEEYSDDYGIKDWKAVVVDGEKIKPDTWYALKDGEFVEVED